MRKILVVEDDEKVREALCELLHDEGYECFQAANGEEAIARLGTAGELPFLILLDLYMPRMNGWQLSAWLRQDPLYSTIPVVVLSALEDLGRDARAIGAADFVLKPIEPEALLRAVAKHAHAAAA